MSHSCTRDQDGNRLYNSTGEKARFGKVDITRVRDIMQHLVDNTPLFVVHEAGVSWRFDPHGGSLDPVSNAVDTGPPCVCVVYNLQPSVLRCRISHHH